MQIQNLGDFDEGSNFEADLVIVGGGPSGLTIAHEFAGRNSKVLLLESGLAHEDATHASLAEVESVGEPLTEAQREKRRLFHGSSSNHWSPDLQPFGVRCRALGGSSNAWAGKSAPFDRIDYERRPWVDHSGWPISQDEMRPYIERAISVLNLSSRQPEQVFEEQDLRSFFWQFARSRIDKLDIMRFGDEIPKTPGNNVNILLNSTVTNIGLSTNGLQSTHVDFVDIGGRRFSVKAKIVVLAASGIENPRLLLASNTVQPNGIGNSRDIVGRFLMDHPGARVAQVSPAFASPFMRLFRFQSVLQGGRAHIFMHGLALTPEIQKEERLLNAAVYFITQHAPDDPWDALKRLLRRNSDKPLRDLAAVLSGAGLLAKGGATSALSSRYLPSFAKEAIISAAIRVAPNQVAEDFQTQGIPHKITGLSLDAITEQMPNPNSRVMLSNRRDRFGVPLAKVNWIINDIETRTLSRIANLTKTMFDRVGLPDLPLENWVISGNPSEAKIIDMAHTLGATRMSNDAHNGVVDRNCRIHGVEGLYVAGGSVFPTSGHANPTLMIIALAIRLADHLKLKL